MSVGLPTITVDFAGELHHPGPDQQVVVGREGDILIDDNPFMHRRFLEIGSRQALWWLSNVGSQLTATIADETGSMQAWLAPAASLPLVFPRTYVWFTAGSTSYELEIQLSEPIFEPVSAASDVDGSLTIGQIVLTPDQRLLIIGLCEQILRSGPTARTSIPQSSQVAARLGWTITKFNRKLDNVCEKLGKLGVRGLHGDSERLATSRRTRLVEYAMAARLVDRVDLSLLP